MTISGSVDIRALLVITIISAAACAHAPAAPQPPAVAASDGGVARLVVPRAERGRPARVVVEIEARPGFHLNADYPHFVEFDIVSISARATTKRVDKQSGLVVEACAGNAQEHCRARAAAEVIPDIVGDVPIRIRAAYAVCDEERCLIEKPELSAILHVDNTR